MLLAGTPGTLKSTIAYNMACRNVKNDGARILYLILDRSKETFLEQVSWLGLGDAGANLMIYDLAAVRTNLSQFKGGNWWEPLKNYLIDYKYNFDFNMLVLDSLQVLELVVKMPDARTEMYNIFEWLRYKLKVTGILISEIPSDSRKYSRYDEEILADGIIHLSMQENESDVERKIRCVKMAGVGHNTNHLRLSIRNNELYAEKATGKRIGSVASLVSTDSFSF